ncbi:hypothetical protein FE257_008457 [Aspergillus nanangensis]|uniref:Uncharacterized protein n=1 Tax=Aspergillus nanangensis TaxID=2582783 RepID=A0AAD4CLF6_ASPNN|nr:hypothetical protein FE257_008457 [Aspergillus nanangensis]
MDIALLLNPAPSEDDDSSVTDTRNQHPEEVRLRKRKYLPSFGPGVRSQERHLVHPQPIRPTLPESPLDQVGGPCHGKTLRPLYENNSIPTSRHILLEPSLSPSNKSSHEYSVQSRGGTWGPWNPGDPIPPGMRLTVPPYPLKVPVPKHGRILIPEGENAESLRPYLECAAPASNSSNQCNDVEHHAAIDRMQEPDPIPFTYLPVPPDRPRYTPRNEDNDPPVPNPPVTPIGKHSAQKIIDESIVPKHNREVILTEFEIVTAHTAKCDLCNKRNTLGMSRCLSCGWQSCHPCTSARGWFRTHHAGTRIHTGPIDQSLLESSSRLKGKKSAKSKARNDITTRSPHSTKGKSRKHSRRTRALTGRKKQKSSATTPADSSPSQADDATGTDPLLNGAQNLYDLSSEALESLSTEESLSGGIQTPHNIRSRRGRNRDENAGRVGTEIAFSNATNHDYDPESEPLVFGRRFPRRGTH